MPIAKVSLAAERIDGSALIRALGSIVGQDISNLLLLPANQLDAENDLSKIRLHSVLAILLSKTAKLIAEGLLDFMTVDSTELESEPVNELQTVKARLYVR